MSEARPKWSYSAGDKPYTVTVYEREPGGVLYVRIWNPSKQRWARRSLRHDDRKKAKAHALEQSAKLMKGITDLREGKTALVTILALYARHRTPRKTPGEQRSDERRTRMWTQFLGANRDPYTISLGQWESFHDLRRSGKIDARANSITQEELRRPVRERCVEADLMWLKKVFSWAVNWRLPDGQYLMRENPVRGYSIPTERNPRRPVATTDRYEAIRRVSDQVLMEVWQPGKRPKQRSYLSELLDLAHTTGRRISAICQLRYVDLCLEKTPGQPFGAILWPGDTDKEGKDWTSPLHPIARSAIDRVLAERPGIGPTPMFPVWKDREPVHYRLASSWLRQAEILAGVKSHEGRLWHAYRAGWATSRKAVPVQDVAAAGGWKSNQVVRDLYQQADPATVLKAVLHTDELRDVK